MTGRGVRWFRGLAPVAIIGTIILVSRGDTTVNAPPEPPVVAPVAAIPEPVAPCVLGIEQIRAMVASAYSGTILSKSPYDAGCVYPIDAGPELDIDLGTHRPPPPPPAPGPPPPAQPGPPLTTNLVTDEVMVAVLTGVGDYGYHVGTGLT